MERGSQLNGGYGGGIKITRDDRLIVSVKGGERLSAAGLIALAGIEVAQ